MDLGDFGLINVQENFIVVGYFSADLDRKSKNRQLVTLKLKR